MAQAGLLYAWGERPLFIECDSSWLGCGWTAEELWFNFGQSHQNCFFSKSIQTGSEADQAACACVPRPCPLGCEEVHHSPACGAWVKNVWSCASESASVPLWYIQGWYYLCQLFCSYSSVFKDSFFRISYCVYKRASILPVFPGCVPFFDTKISVWVGFLNL